MSTTGGLLARLRQPEYTGENRCLPCTAVNTVIAAVASVVLGLAISSAGGPLAGLALGLVSFAGALTAIYLRGYLVPGTPTLTKRYFPDWLLAWFGKAPDESEPVEYEGEFDPEAELTAVDALEECPDGPDLCLTDRFRADWQAEIERVKAAEADREQLLALLGIDEGDVEYEEYGDAFRALVDGQVVGKWESRAAFLADLGSATVLSERHPEWTGLPLQARSQLLNGLRLFIDTCPACGGNPEFGTDTVESCCTTHDVAAVSCPKCGARLFESTPI